MKMKICFIGLGSIGKRHIRNLHAVLCGRGIAHEIDALRSRALHVGQTGLPREIEALLHNCYHDPEELPEDYDIIFVTNPTVLHYDTISRISGKARYLFIEKPVFDAWRKDPGGIVPGPEQNYYVACPMRYTPVIQYLKEHLEQESVYSVRAITSSYLPDWRRGADYRDVYSAHKEMGGGVTLDLIHEMDYITYLFGEPSEVLHFSGKYSGLEIDSDDLSIYMLRYEDKLAEIHLDYFGRKTVRILELFCRDYVIRGDFIRNTLCRVSEEREEWIPLKEEDEYLNEMEYFIDLVQGKEQNRNTIQHANAVLKLAAGSPDNGKQ